MEANNNLQDLRQEQAAAGPPHEPEDLSQVEKMYQTCVYCMNSKRDSMYNEYSFKDEFLKWLAKMEAEGKISTDAKTQYTKKINGFLPEKYSAQERNTFFR